MAKKKSGAKKDKKAEKRVAKKAPKKAGKKATKKAAKKAAKKAGKKAAKKAAKKNKVEAVPSKYGTATPHLIVSPCGEAIEFYGKAFGAKLLSSMPGPGGVMMHAEIKIGDSIVMLADEQPPMPGMPASRKTPRNAGATTGGVMLFVPDVDAFYTRAVTAGATAVMPPADMFWGDRYGQLEDPFGHVWAVATHLRDMSDAEMMEAMAAMGPPQG